MKQNTKNHNVSRIVLRVLAGLLLGSSFLLYFSAIWYVRVYGDTGFDSILFTMLSGLAGVASGLWFDWLIAALLPTLFFTALLYGFIFFEGKWALLLKRRKTGKKIRLYPFKRRFRAVISVALSLGIIWFSAMTVRFHEYVRDLLTQTTLYNDEYVDPKKVKITFPENKRNLIYIFLESMETTFFSKEKGGAQSEDVIPQLYKLANDNINFSQNNNVGGWSNTDGTTWTVASMVAQTSGIPLRPPVLENQSEFLPGVTTLSDILHKAGYNQAVILGSKKEFAGKDKFFSTHGFDRICDYNAAVKDGVIPKDYWVWWGFEDKRLFPYAKQIITEMASSDSPFAITLLTADTHSEANYPGGYVCEDCENEYEEQYENVYACSSRQTAEFIKWIKKQPFYENTTVVICGDHLSMNEGYFRRKGIDDENRYVYNCFLNSAVTTERTKNRAFSPMDIFPTVLAAMGCQIKGDRLGLGVNLFSDLDTICERNGTEWLNEEIRKSSEYYSKHFVRPH